jgi:hypothetical protein
MSFPIIAGVFWSFRGLIGTKVVFSVKQLDGLQGELFLQNKNGVNCTHN